MYGLTDEIMKKIKSITDKYDVTFLIFGSRARGDFKVTSDIDIAVKDIVTQEEKYKIINDFDLLDIAYKIDLVFMQDVSNYNFVKSIEEEGKVL